VLLVSSFSLFGLLVEEREGCNVGSQMTGAIDGELETSKEGCGDKVGCMVQFEAYTSAQHLDQTKR